MLKTPRISFTKLAGKIGTSGLAMLPALTLLLSNMCSVPVANASAQSSSPHCDPNALFVSRRSTLIDPEIRTGKSWGSAFADFDEVKFPAQTGKFTLYVDGGGKKMTYYESLKIPAGVSVDVVQATDTNHKGIVEISGEKSKDPDGILIEGAGTVTIGKRTANDLLSQTPIIIRGFNRSGIHVGPNAGTVNVFGVLIGNNGSGDLTKGSGVLIEGGTAVSVNESMIRNNPVNVMIASRVTGGNYSFDRDWIYWSHYNDNVSQGIRVQSAAGGKVTVTTSVLGPALDFALANVSGGTVHMSHCLLLNTQRAALQIGARPKELKVDHITSFMTRNNAKGNGAFQLRSDDRLDGSVTATNSVVYDGSVSIPMENIGYAQNVNNFQTRIDGLKTFFAKTQETGPIFANETLSNLSNTTSVKNLIELNFNLADDSKPKAAGAGSNLTSIKQLQPPADL